MPRKPTNVDYSKISREHKELVRRLVSPRGTTEDWEKFYSTIRDMVTNRYAAKLWDEAELDVEDFLRGELTSFLLANKCERLRQFLNLKSVNSDHQHLFGDWFDKVIKSALAAATPNDRGDTIYGDDEKKKSSDKTGKPETIFDGIDAKDRFVALNEKGNIRAPEDHEGARHRRLLCPFRGLSWFGVRERFFQSS